MLTPSCSVQTLFRPTPGSQGKHGLEMQAWGDHRDAPSWRFRWARSIRDVHKSKKCTFGGEVFQCGIRVRDPAGLGSRAEAGGASAAVRRDELDDLERLRRFCYSARRQSFATTREARFGWEVRWGGSTEVSHAVASILDCALCSLLVSGRAGSSGIGADPRRQLSTGQGRTQGRANHQHRTTRREYPGTMCGSSSRRRRPIPTTIPV